MGNVVNLNFDSTQVKPSEGVNTDPIPVGRYKMAIEDSDYKPGSKPSTMVLAITLAVLEGEFKGRKVFENLNLVNPSAQAQMIASEQLSAICRATGVIKPGPSTDLHGRPFEADVGIDKGSEKKDPITQLVVAEYPPKNKILKYYSLTGIPLAQITSVGAAPAFVPQAPPLNAPGVTQAPKLVMTAKANGATYEQFTSTGWTDAALVAQGYAEPARAPAAPPPPMPQGSSVPAPPAPAQTFQPTAPGMGNATPAPASTAEGEVPNWLRGVQG